MVSKGADVGTIGFALAVTFAGGATGKFICGFLASKFGIIHTVILTEAITCFGIAIILPLSLNLTLVLLPLIGIGSMVLLVWHLRDSI